MALMTWDQKYTVQVFEFDAQHKHLFDLLNRLHEAMAKGQGNKVMAKTLAELVTYTNTHFRAEERLMQSKQYPGFAAHKAEHDHLTERVLKFQEDFAAGRASVSSELMNFLRYWLTNHILHTDKQYSGFLNQNGLK